MSKPPRRIHTGSGLDSILSDVRSKKAEWRQEDGADIERDYIEG
jgi:hypothetical protein